MVSDQSYTVNLEQVGEKPRYISIRTFSGEFAPRLS
jgi:hypothetical protein